MWNVGGCGSGGVYMRVQQTEGTKDGEANAHDFFSYSLVRRGRDL